ncbi:MAG: thioesterase family protein [Rhodospirillaceae bacterium]
MAREPAPVRGDYSFFRPIQVRWGDYDLLGHINNVQYIRYWEYMVVQFVGEECGESWTRGAAIPFAAENSCRFLRPLNAGPLGPVGITLEAGLRIERIGTSSVHYALSLFEPEVAEAAATGAWVHVWVDTKTHRPVPIPDEARMAYERHVMER